MSVSATSTQLLNPFRDGDSATALGAKRFRLNFPLQEGNWGSNRALKLSEQSCPLTSPQCCWIWLTLAISLKKKIIKIFFKKNHWAGGRTAACSHRSLFSLVKPYCLSWGPQTIVMAEAYSEHIYLVKPTESLFHQIFGSQGISVRVSPKLWGQIRMSLMSSGDSKVGKKASGRPWGAILGVGISSPSSSFLPCTWH